MDGSTGIKELELTDELDCARVAELDFAEELEVVETLELDFAEEFACDEDVSLLSLELEGLSDFHFQESPSLVQVQ
jgi:hypothetical protein